jgi:hypothetical protein
VPKLAKGNSKEAHTPNVKSLIFRLLGRGECCSVIPLADLKSRGLGRVRVGSRSMELYGQFTDSKKKETYFQMITSDHLISNQAAIWASGGRKTASAFLYCAESISDRIRRQ